MSNVEQSFLGKVTEKFFPPKPLNRKEELIVEIIETLCGDEDTDIKVAPVSGRYFLINKKMEYWVRINEFEVSITNHKFTLNYIGTPNYHSKLVEVVRGAVEKARDIFEKTVFENEVELLENIKFSLTNK